jgi:hypothetical protein
MKLDPASLNLTDPDLHDDPWELYRRLRGDSTLVLSIRSAPDVFTPATTARER